MSELDQNYRFSASGMSNALFPVSPDRTNQQRPQHSRESSVTDQVHKFNSMASISRTAERGVNDAALKRAMMAREEAQSEARKYRLENESLQGIESDMRRYREEAAQYNREVKIISERYENLVEQFMAEKENHSRDKDKLDEYREKYARARETHETTQKTWEKELRAARKVQKESFKVQSRLVQLQDELRSAKNSITLMKVSVEEGKERTKAREEEAFAAKCEAVSLQEDLANTKEKVKLVEQERDALRTIAKNEEVLRIAAEGQIPLPSSPQKKSRPEATSPGRFTTSAASEEELEELKWKMQWERKRLERAFELIDFMKAECQFKCCSCRIAGTAADYIENGVQATETHKNHQQHQHSNDCSSSSAKAQQEKPERTSLSASTEATEQEVEEDETTTIFIPSEGIFRTMVSPAKKPYQLAQKRPIEKVSSSRPTSSATNKSFPRARTPSIDPPAPAIQPDLNTSLLSLLGSFDEQAIEDEEDEKTVEVSKEQQKEPESAHKHWQTISTTTRIPLKPDTNTPVTARTTKIPLSQGYAVSNINFTTFFNDENKEDVHLRGGGGLNNLTEGDSNAIIGTMTKEQALEQIKLRRGRARSIAQGTLTPRKKMCEGVGSYERRDISAPAAVAMKGFGVRTPKSAPPNRTKFGA